MTVSGGDERISLRETFTIEHLDDSRPFDILGLSLESLRQRVAEKVGGRPVRQQWVYLTVEAVVAGGPSDFGDWPDDDLPFYGGEAA